VPGPRLLARRTSRRIRHWQGPAQPGSACTSPL